MKRAHYSWLICAGCTILLFCTLGLTTSAFLIYQPYIIEAGNLSNAQGSSIIAVQNISSLIAMLFVNRYYQLTNLRVGMMVACICTAISFLFYGLSSSFGGFILAAAMSGISRSLGGMIPVSIIINRWFHSHKALALGICSAGSGIATIIIPPIFTILAETTTLSVVFFTEASFALLVAVIDFIILRDSPEQIGLLPLATAKKSKPSNVHNLSEKKECGTIVYMIIVVILIGGFSNPAFAHLSVLYKKSGFDNTSVAALASITGIALMIGKGIYGWLADKLGTYKSAIICFSLVLSGQILCCFANNLNLITAIIGMICLGLGLPIATVGLSVLAGDFATAGSYGKTVTYFQIAYMSGALALGAVPGIIADTTGSYVPAYMLFSILVVIAAILFYFVYRKRRI